MNQSSLSVTESGKSAALLKAGAAGVKSSDEAGDAEESGSFLSKLVAIFRSEEKDPDTKVTETSSAESGTASEKLLLTDESEEIATEPETDFVSDAQEYQVSADDPAEQTDSENTSVSSKASQAMYSGNRLLERLDESNQVLQGTSGKDLPRSEQILTADAKASQITGAEQQSPDISLQPQQMVSIEHRVTGSDPLIAGQDAVPAEVQKTVSDGVSVQGVPVMSSELSAELQTQDITADPTGAEHLVNTKQGVAGGEWDVQLESMPDMQTIHRAVMQGKTVTPETAHTEKFPESQAALVWDTQVAETPLMVPASSEMQLLSPGVGDPVVQVSTSEQSFLAQDEGELSLQEQATVMDAGKTSVDLSKLQSESFSSQSQNRHQLLHQQVAQAQSMAQISPQQAEKLQASPLTTATLVQPELNTAGMPSFAANTVPAGNVQEMKTMLATTAGVSGAKGLSAAKNGNKDSELSQQLAGLAGQQGSTTVQSRIEAQQATGTQPALQLNRDMAGDQLAERVQMMMSKNLKNIDIRLDPPELGRMHIRMTMHGDGASVQFTVANPQARDMVEHAMPKLREMLAQQGVQLADTSVHQQNSGQQRQYSAGNGSGGESSYQGQKPDEGTNLDEGINLDVNIAAKDDGISYYA
ncbi:hypothetical protein CSW98_03865 [Vibrio sp. HA2012]|uniref:flagellar hook-length control protein FliK n=1 Tax=Vibrio sp. HA2012 TaxID=1971595 RepID=UPI000C2B53A3|nr:flagellar hook-length control protein FliK [Vibrio sp. HA2012]PJC88263.1 hypothetical protein CSW98_03865 [Vibrio sp. HA2012]